MTSDAIARYHDLLATGTLAADSQEQLDRLQSRRGLTYGTRPVCTVLRPRFLTLEQYRFLRDRVERLLPAFNRIHERALADLTFRRQFRLQDWEEELLAIEPGYRPPWPTSRLDSFFVSERDLKFTEFNTETPAGAGYSDALADLFHGLPAFQEFQRFFQTFPVPCQPGVLHVLLDAYRSWRGAGGEAPRIAILDWREVPTFSEFVLFYDYFQGLGIEARNVDPREVTYADGKLMAGDFHITLIYKRVLISELIERGGLEHPVVQAVRDGAVCLVNSFRCKVLFKKASFAVLTDERNADLFTADEARLIAEHIPWTRVVEERQTQFRGEVVELVPFVLANRERLVLKPNDQYGGKGIVLGWTVGEAEWERAVHGALAEPTVIQERIALPVEPYPSFLEGELRVVDRLQDTNPYVASGAYLHGCLTRISTDELVSVTAGGGSTVPTFLIEGR